MRSWEARYGFPAPSRLPGGHRRYAERDVAAVEEVLRYRRAGLGLEAAVRRATEGLVPESSSVFAELRRRHSDLIPQALSKRSLLALSRAIEDECCAQAQRPLLFASFQTEHFYRASQVRWVELARTARSAVVFADFARPGRVEQRPVEVPVPYDASINREWALVCDAADYPACMVGWERPGERRGADRDRQFEVLWSVDPQVVRDATRVCVRLADAYRPGWREEEWPELAETPPPASADLRRASSLLNRMVGYLESTP